MNNDNKMYQVGDSIMTGTKKPSVKDLIDHYTKVDIESTANSECKHKDDEDLHKIETALCRSDFKILVIDDVKAVRSTYKSLLKKQCGFVNVDIAANGLEGYKMIRNKDYDLILCDYDMPIMNGFELYERIKFDIPRSKSNFVIISGCSDTILECLKADNVLTFPKTQGSEILELLYKVSMGYYTNKLLKKYEDSQNE